MSKTCTDCGADYGLNERRCPNCGSTNFVGGASSADDIDKLFAQFDSESVQLTNQGTRAFNSGNFDEAIRCSKKAIKLDPNEARAYGTLGLALAQKGNTAEAITNLEKALSIDSSLDPLKTVLSQLKAAGGQGSTSAAGQKDGSGCFVATACYGSYEAPEVKALRAFRDKRLLPSPIGAILVRAYYRISPPIASALRSRPWARRLVKRFLIDPVVMIVGTKR
ncbi:MAG: CFI-box-CTERM domain-containing protein [Pseudomonadota bacterium]